MKLKRGMGSPYAKDVPNWMKVMQMAAPLRILPHHPKNFNQQIEERYQAKAHAYFEQKEKELKEELNVGR